MRIVRFLIVSLVLCAQAAVSSLAEAAAAPPRGADISPFVGIWYGVGEPDDPSISYIDSYQADGTYHSEFRKCVGTQVVWHQTATGKWSMANRVLRMVADTVDGKPDRFENSYTIDLIAQDEFRARLVPSDFLFIEKRIEKFEFPPCYVGA